VARAVIFDFDGLIVDTEMPEFLAWQSVYARRGLVFPLASWLQNVGRNDGPFDPLGPFRGGDADAVRAEWRAEHASLEPAFLVPLPGVVPLLDAVRGLGWRTAIASSSRHERVAGLVARLGLTARFDAIAAGDEVASAKPAPDVYLLAARRLDVPPDACTALEDSETGARAAKAAGMLCIAVPSTLTRSLDFSHADVVLDTLHGAAAAVIAVAEGAGRSASPDGLA